MGPVPAPKTKPEVFFLYDHHVRIGTCMSHNKIEVGVLGATGMVGQQFVSRLAAHPWFNVSWLAASER